jgi:aspartyl-tRNA(Asn)/glutamyl-tRNA(Gln) amidotransferase subunit C
MMISIEEVRKIADLARIKLTAQEEKRHAETISTVLEYMKILNEVDTTGIELTAQVTGLENVSRSDIVEKSDTRAELLAQMPKTKMEELVVPAVFDN